MLLNMFMLFIVDRVVHAANGVNVAHVVGVVNVG